MHQYIYWHLVSTKNIETACTKLSAAVASLGHSLTLVITHEDSSRRASLISHLLNRETLFHYSREDYSYSLTDSRRLTHSRTHVHVTHSLTWALVASLSVKHNGAAPHSRPTPGRHVFLMAPSGAVTNYPLKALVCPFSFISFCFWHFCCALCVA